ncbi:MAG: nucleotidyltransferase domain-containing protein [Synechococcus sp. ELA619]
MTQATPAVAAGGQGHPWAVTTEKVNDVVNRLVAAASPLRLIAFGSAARGELVAANDLDLLVVEPELTSRYSEMVRLQKALRGVLMSVDLVVTSEARYDERSRIPGTVEFTACHEGLVLHDSL